MLVRAFSAKEARKIARRQTNEVVTRVQPSGARWYEVKTRPRNTRRKKK